jgi:hypothetical protein
MSLSLSLIQFEACYASREDRMKRRFSEQQLVGFWIHRRWSVPD